MARIHVVAIETIAKPRDYTDHQLKTALQLAHTLNRGRFVLCTKPDQQ